MITDAQRREFDEIGLLRLPQAVAAAEAQLMRDRVWDAMAAKGIRRDDPSTWTQVSGSFFRKTAAAGAFNPMATPAVRQALDGLFGDTPWEEPPHWGGPMVTFPNTPQWEIPRGGWHLDGPARHSAASLSRIVVFVFLDRVSPGGGGTVVAAGSHKVVRDLLVENPSSSEWGSGRMRQELEKNEPWFKELLAKDGPANRQQKLTTPSPSLQGHSLHVIECTGEAGDVFMTHPWLFHGGAPNGNAAPRQMLKEFIHRQEDAAAG